MRFSAISLLACVVFPVFALAEPISVGPGTGVLTLPTTRSECGPLVAHVDGSYETGISWRTGGVAPPDFGAFAERFEGPKSVCAFVVDHSQDGFFEDGQTADFFIYSNEDREPFDTPGSVLFVMHDVSPWPIAIWPAVTRVVVPLAAPFNIAGSWWVGIWGNWPDAPNGWYLAADLNGSATSVPMTNVIANGFPPGWQPVGDIWPTVVALGIGVEAMPLTPVSVPDSPVRLTSFGRVKDLYR